MALTLKAARVNSNLTRPTVIERLNAEYGIKITVNTLANYENSKSQPDINTGKALAAIYGLSVDNIIFL
jgi:transcriptional regulator with XRE-family HTH domain